MSASWWSWALAPLAPRMHLFEIDDQPWFHPFLRARVQAALTVAWSFRVPLLQPASPSRLLAALLAAEVPDLPAWVVIDFCAGGGGPTPAVERLVNSSLSSSSPTSSPEGHGGSSGPLVNGVNGNGTANGAHPEPVRFVLTDLHPHVADWAEAAARSRNIAYEPQPVDASAVSRAMIDKYAAAEKGKRKKVFRMFNLAFHHFDDPLARAILKNTLETSDGFGIFELQDRSLASFLTTCIFGLGILLSAPYYALWAWGSPLTLLFTYLVPVLPFVLVFDGWVSGLRARTPDEVEALLRSCGADPAGWELRSGRERHLWPCGYLFWMVCIKKDEAAGAGKASTKKATKGESGGKREKREKRK